MPAGSALPLVLFVACTAPVPKIDPPTTPWTPTDETEAPLATLGDPAFVARIDVGEGYGAVFALPGDLTGDGGPDLLATDYGVTTWLVAGPLAGDVRVEDDAAAAFFSSTGDIVLPSRLIPVGDSDGDGRAEFLVHRADGVARLDLPVTGDVDVDALPLVLDFGGRFIDPAQVTVMRIGDQVWVGGDVAQVTGEGWLLDGPWTGARRLEDAVLHVFGSVPVVTGEYAYYERVVAHRPIPLGDLDASGTLDISLYQPAAFFDLGLRGELSLAPTQDAAFAIPWGVSQAAIGDVTGDGLDDLLVVGLEAGTSCVLAGPVGRDTPGIATAPTEGCALVLEDSYGDWFQPGAAAWPLGDVDGDGAGEWLVRGDSGSGAWVLRGGLTGVVDVADARLATHLGEFATSEFGAPIGELDGTPGMDLIVVSRPESGDSTWWELHRAIP